MKGLRIFATVALVIAIMAGGLAAELLFFARQTVLSPVFYRDWLRERGLYAALYGWVLDAAGETADSGNMADTLRDAVEESLPQDDFEELCGDYFYALMRYLKGRTVRADFDFEELIEETVRGVMSRMMAQALASDEDFTGVMRDSGLSAWDIYGMDDAAMAELLGVTPEQAALLHVDESVSLSASLSVGGLARETERIPFSTNWSREAREEFEEVTQDLRAVAGGLDDAFTAVCVLWGTAVALLFAVWIPVMRPAFTVSGALLLVNGAMTVVSAGMLLVGSKLTGWNFSAGTGFAGERITAFVTDALMPAAGIRLLIAGGCALALGAAMLVSGGLIGRSRQKNRQIPPLPMAASR